MINTRNPTAPMGATGVLLLVDADGGTQIIWGDGFGAIGSAVGEICFNTAITGYQETMTDPSYAGQIITFTFPHIGNVGTNDDDIEADNPHALGCIVRDKVTEPANFRSTQGFMQWMKVNGCIGICGIDTRALTRHIRHAGASNAVIAHNPDGHFDMDALISKAKSWGGLAGLDLAKDVTGDQTKIWDSGTWQLGHGYASLDDMGAKDQKRPHVVAMDFGAKHNIFRNLVKAGAKVTVVNAKTGMDEIMALKPDGVFLSNGPGDPAATGIYAVPVIKELLEKDIPIFGICLGHQMLALAAGAKTVKMHQGHRGANHPVQRIGGDQSGLVEITSMNHGFAVDGDTLPDNVRETHKSLFDGSNCGIEIIGKKAFGVQYHPEASPGPQDSIYLFEKFIRGLV